MKFQSIKCWLLLLLAAVGFVSCSETKDEVEEYTRWQETNESYWTQLYNTTKGKIAAGDNSWKLFLNYSFENQTPNGDAIDYAPSDYVIVHVLEEGAGSGCPMYTDTARVHYRGRLIPSATYTAGFQFDSSWKGDYNLQTMRPADFAVSDVVDGFCHSLAENAHWRPLGGVYPVSAWIWIFSQFVCPGLFHTDLRCDAGGLMPVREIRCPRCKQAFPLV